ncbi:Ger(x)C family spore germination protein [Desulfosporosinus sp. OT]|uniref:Ger(x)C family spore germination protein n=1 Tax=Desulfosporosinus sp. OT TaxID=913865 RepID=UPI000223AF89|nr:Ger(x)C family spore germination protein [Desulfosporosinus sp. OT]EGW36803.1 germination, Ger(x)C family protein [Desulfosporosinus sp. OT]
MRKGKRVIYTLLILVIPLLISGCWDRKELEGRAIVTLIAIDKGENNQIKFSVQIARTSDSQASSNGGSSGGEKSSIIMSGTGDTVFDAIRNLILKAGRKLYYPHNTAIILGNDIAREGILPELDLFNRDAEMRPLTWILVTPGQAADILEAQSTLESLSAKQLDMMLTDFGASSKTVATNLLDTMKQLAYDSPGAVLSNIELDPSNPKKTLLLNGAAVFRRDKLIGRLDPLETRGYLWVKDKVNAGIITFPCPGEETKKISMEIKKAKGKIEPDISEGKFNFTITVNVVSRLAEQECLTDLGNPEELMKLKKSQNEVIEKEIRNIVDKAQDKYGTDILGFGTELSRKFPQEWQKIKDNWTEEFPKAEVNIVVNSKISDIGLVKKPL